MVEHSLDLKKQNFENLLTKKIDNFFSENNWDSNNYAKNTLKDRKDLGQFFTPSVLCAKMLAKLSKVKEAYLDEEGNVKEEYKTKNPVISDEPLFDPTAGCGNLLAAGIAIGWNPEWIYANELDPKIYEVLVEGLTKLSVPKDHIRCGDIFEMTKEHFKLMDEQKPICGVLLDEISKEEYEKLNESEKKLYFAICDNKTGKPTGKYKRKGVKKGKSNKTFSLNQNEKNKR